MGARAVLTERVLTLAPISIIGNRVSVQLRARKGAVAFGTAGVRHSWGLRREFMSPRYTTVWDELLRVQERAGTTMCGRFTQNYTREEVYAFLKRVQHAAQSAPALQRTSFLSRASRTRSRADRPKLTQGGRSAVGR